MTNFGAKIAVRKLASMQILLLSFAFFAFDKAYVHMGKNHLILQMHKEYYSPNVFNANIALTPTKWKFEKHIHEFQF